MNINKKNTENNNIVIWGTRVFGNLAYVYYKNKQNILCYIDNDSSKWGEELNGIKICSPEILRKVDARVIIALKNGIENIKKQLQDEYGIYTYVLFEISEAVCIEEDCPKICEVMPEDTCVISYGGGLGNQMFQYALHRNLELTGKNVVADLDSYLRIGVMEFQLTEVFKGININVCTKRQVDELIKKNTLHQYKGKKFILYDESLEYWTKKSAELSLLDISGGVIRGMHQTYCFANRIRNTLLQDFQFDLQREEKLNRLYGCIGKTNSVSIHVRRGDYLIEENRNFYENICDDCYYYSAIDSMRKKVGNCIFYFFSDDIEWVREHYKLEDAVYVSADMFDRYQNWYDMCLMSACRHNIIANSTFSWWGAWLNQNVDKIVIAPNKWINLYDYEDIYPKEWTVMNNKGR